PANASAFSEGTSAVTAATYDGTAHIHGDSVTSPGAYGQARETAKSKLSAGMGSVERGRLTWAPQGTATAFEETPITYALWLFDPIWFDVINLDTNEEYYNEVLHMNIHLPDTAQGAVEFADGNMHVTAREMTLDLSISDPFVAQSGFASL